MGGLFDITGRSDCPRGVSKLEQTMDAQRREDVLLLIESARDRWSVVDGVL